MISVLQGLSLTLCWLNSTTRLPLEPLKNTVQFCNRTTALCFPQSWLSNTIFLMTSNQYKFKPCNFHFPSTLPHILHFCNTDLPSYPMNLTLWVVIWTEDSVSPWDASFFLMLISQCAFLWWSGLLSPLWMYLFSFYAYTTFSNAFISWSDIVVLHFCSSEFCLGVPRHPFKSNCVYSNGHTTFSFSTYWTNGKLFSTVPITFYVFRIDMSVFQFFHIAMSSHMTLLCQVTWDLLSSVNHNIMKE